MWAQRIRHGMEQPVCEVRRLGWVLAGENYASAFHDLSAEVIFVKKIKALPRAHFALFFGM